MNIKQSEKNEFSEKVKKATPNSPILGNCIKAFVSGGLLCVIAQALNNWFKNMGYSQDDRGLIVSLIFIGATALLTGLGLFSKIGKFCGAGTFVPITGFANSMASPAIEFKKEGWVLGLGAKMFNLAGPVIVYGLTTSVIVGFFYYLFGGVL